MIGPSIDFRVAGRMMAISRLLRQPAMVPQRAKSRPL